MLAKKPVQLVVIALGALVALALAFYPTDEKRVRAAAEAIIDAANTGQLELARALDTYAVPNVSVTVSELPEPWSGRSALVAAAGQAEGFGHELKLRLEAVDVTVEGKRARLNADLISAARAEVPELRRPRHCVAIFEERAGQFRLVSAEIGAEQRDQPEARP